MLFRRVLGLVATDAHQRQLHLQRRGTDQPGKLHLGLDLVGHEIEQADLQRANVLANGHGFGHDPHALMHEGFKGGQRIGDPDRHLTLDFPCHGGFETAETKTPAAFHIATGPRKVLLTRLGPLATYFTWLQAGRPNHHGTRGLLRLSDTRINGEGEEALVPPPPRGR